MWTGELLACLGCGLGCWLGCRLCAAAKRALGPAGTLSCLLAAAARERLSQPNPPLPPPLRSAIANVINNKEDAGWGPNAVFR